MLRRLAAILYDGLLVLAIWMIGTLPLVILLGDSIDANNFAFKVYLAVLAYAYFHLSWRNIGQTLGMRSWRLHLVRDEDAPPAWMASLIRLAVALVSAAAAGLGFASALWRPDRRTWHDRVSRTRLEWRPRSERSSLS